MATIDTPRGDKQGENNVTDIEDKKTSFNIKDDLEQRKLNKQAQTQKNLLQTTWALQKNLFDIFIFYLWVVCDVPNQRVSLNKTKIWVKLLSNLPFVSESKTQPYTT